MCLQQGKILNL